ncbi:DUF1178 family protein [Hydrogenophaga atypica]|uniref:DUF1178 family protein n=1 Tax=Hydrogenophaga atypica TaxID=249409 RepID=A0ABW2QFH7_9BURK
MKVLNLRCGAQHVFEGWFGSELDFQDQLSRGLLTCPLCGDTGVEKMLSAPRLNLAGAAANVPAPPTPVNSTTQPTATDARLWQAMRTAIARAENVGDRFADEARRIHHGEAEARQIRGQASLQDTLALLEEGVPVLPLPPALKETLQ